MNRWEEPCWLQGETDTQLRWDISVTCNRCFNSFFYYFYFLKYTRTPGQTHSHVIKIENKRTTSFKHNSKQIPSALKPAGSCTSMEMCKEAGAKSARHNLLCAFGILHIFIFVFVCRQGKNTERWISFSFIFDIFQQQPEKLIITHTQPPQVKLGLTSPRSDNQNPVK